MGGFIRYGIVKQDFIIIKGTCIGPRKRPITLRKPIIQPSGSGAAEEIDVKFIDTSSQFGNGRFQTSEEKKNYFGTTKKDRLKEQAKKSQERKQKKGQEAESGAAAPEKAAKEPKSSDKGQKKKGGKGKGSKKKGSGKKVKTEKVKTGQK